MVNYRTAAPALAREVVALRAINASLAAAEADQIAMCVACGPCDHSDEDGCCLTCGRDMIIVADAHSADMVREHWREAEEVERERNELRLTLDAARGIAPDDGRRHTLLVHLTPHLLGRVQALGYAPGETPEGLLPWLVAGLEEARKGEVEAVGRKGERWFVVHQRDGQPFVETFIGAGAERAAKLTARAHAANWTDTYVMRGREVSSSDFEREAREERAAMLAADKATG